VANSMSTGSLRGRTVLVAGASSGIGWHVARQIAGRGATVVMTARRAELLDSLAAQIRAGGGACLALAADGTDPQAVEAMLAAAETEVGPIHAALLNIGAGPEYHLPTATVADILGAMTNNYEVTVNYLVPLVARMRGRGGLIAHTNSLAGLLGVPMQGPYSAAKAAVRVLLDTYRTELRGSGIRFLSIYPGFVATERTADDGIPAPFEITAEHCAARIVRAMESRRNDVAFPWQTAALTRLLRSVPKPLASRIMLGFVPAGWLDQPAPAVQHRQVAPVLDGRAREESVPESVQGTDRDADAERPLDR
jgi:NAD(P)-dependent dehydrogenase (short-subunit alcohol dehydrogenase family)